MPAIYSHPHVVAPEEIDGLGHVNNLHYLKWMQTAAVAHSAAQGWPTERYRTISAAWVVRSHRIEYRRPAFVGEELEIRTWVSDFNKVRSLRKYQVFRPKDEESSPSERPIGPFSAWTRTCRGGFPPELVQAFQLVPPEEEP